MSPVFQRTGAKTGEHGDCFSACMASVMDLPLAAVPNFNVNMTNGETLAVHNIRKLRKWLHTKGYSYAEIGYQMPTLRNMLDHMYNLIPDTTYLLMGRTNTYRVHCVVAKGGDIIHDPGSEQGDYYSLRGPCPDGFWRVGLFLWNR